MMGIVTCVLALVATPGPNGQDLAHRGNHESRGSQESGSATQPHYPSSGLTLEFLNSHGLPMTRRAAPTYQFYFYQPYPYYGAYPGYGYNSAYSYPHPFGLGGYNPRRSGGYGGYGWWYW